MITMKSKKTGHLYSFSQTRYPEEDTTKYLATSWSNIAWLVMFVKKYRTYRTTIGWEVQDEKKLQL